MSEPETEVAQNGASTNGQSHRKDELSGKGMGRAHQQLPEEGDISETSEPEVTKGDEEAAAQTQENELAEPAPQAREEEEEQNELAEAPRAQEEEEPTEIPQPEIEKSTSATQTVAVEEEREEAQQSLDDDDGPERPTMAEKSTSIYTSARDLMGEEEIATLHEIDDDNAKAKRESIYHDAAMEELKSHFDKEQEQAGVFEKEEGQPVRALQPAKEQETVAEGEDNGLAIMEEVSNRGLEEPTVDGSEKDDDDDELVEEVDPDAPERFADLETAYSWFADHAQGPPEEAEEEEMEIVFQSYDNDNDEATTTELVLGDDDDDDDELKDTSDTTTTSAAASSPSHNQMEEEKKDGDETMTPVPQLELVDNDNNHNNDNDDAAAAAEDTLENPKPLKTRNSLIGRVMTVNEDGDTDVEDEGIVTQVEVEDEDPWVIPDSNLRNPNRRICVVTTAGLPWRTGTAVNPLLRALYLTRGRPKHYVTLVIPWCADENDRNKTLGSQHSFSNQAEQEEWIRDFCRTRANCEEEEKNLKIMFYPSKYNESMGSIFPSVDICALIPEEEADVAILEEPEHLNWLRIPSPYKETEEYKKKKQAQPPAKETLKGKRPATPKEKQELGWRFKFRHVVGIIHTNYKAYAEQYGIGAKFITAPALCALNALVVRAYCHKVILLSGTLPSLTPYKEITCNVHGVRGEFLERPTDTIAGAPKNNEEHAPVYFIGKLIWAKGFDKILDLENLYREKNEDYFPIDVYGAGGDEKAIKRAFFGRIPQIQRSDSSKSDEEKASDPEPETADVFTWETSLRSHLVDRTPFKESEKHASLDEHMAKRRASIIDPDEGNELEMKDLAESPKKGGNIIAEIADKVVPLSVLGNLSLSALDTTKATGGAAVEMVKNVVGAGLNVAFTNDGGSPQRKSKENSESPGSPGKTPKQKLIFDPPQSVFEFRRNPIQARFLGTKDHVLLRDIAAHKVFLNMSITEVLCTTSAEALAMGKFVLLPKHPSNTFFMQFPNCLAYTSLEDCLEKLGWALANDPVPLSEESAKKLSWEGANERLFDSAAVTRDEWEEWAETGKLKSDTDAARFHVETGMKGQLIGKFFTGDKSSKEQSKAES